MRIESFASDDIVVQNRLRSKLNEKIVKDLMDSIQKIGLTELPCVRWTKDDDGGDCAVLVVGWHRLEALKRLGREWIYCQVFEGDAIEARQWEIAENLHRAELTRLERAENHKEWLELAKAKQEQERQEGFLGQVDPKIAKDGSKRGRPEGGDRATIRELGIDRIEARRSKKIANMVPEAKKAVIAAGLADNQTALLTVADTEPEQQVQVVETILHKEKERQEKIEAKRKVRSKATKTNKKVQKPTPEQRMNTARKYLADRLDEDEVRTFGEMLIGICDPLARVLMQ